MHRNTILATQKKTPCMLKLNSLSPWAASQLADVAYLQRVIVWAGLWKTGHQARPPPLRALPTIQPYPLRLLPQLMTDMNHVLLRQLLPIRSIKGPQCLLESPGCVGPAPRLRHAPETPDERMVDPQRLQLHLSLIMTLSFHGPASVFSSVLRSCLI